MILCPKPIDVEAIENIEAPIPEPKIITLAEVRDKEITRLVLANTKSF